MEQKTKTPFQVILLSVIFDPAKRKILIGKRENDPNIPKLSWVFPGGSLLHGGPRLAQSGLVPRSAEARLAESRLSRAGDGLSIFPFHR